MADEVRVPIVADTAPFETALANLTKLSSSFGSQLTGALKSATVSGKSLEDVLRKIGLNLASMALEQGLQPLQRLGNSLFGSLMGGALPFAKGGVVPFASGGVVSSPTYFPMGRNIGLMGEAGAEAILPLQRGSDGRLGVATGGGGNAAPNIVFNVTATDATSFRKSEAQITGMLARAVSRGSRTM
ncbi:phage tail tape measure protein [Chelativorans sp. YIM 93263]|uniref:phage tail tape measure protein n=1 Tax=Chelativorans sp. YIM 93263 TaxID=2906648 RepID=UPI002378E5CB|nr:phage tail tape measure protein [Chelativorans sp. YIM 93263]